MGRAVLQYSHCTSERARGASGRAGRAVCAGRATRVHGTGAGRATLACCWPTGCALGALSLFLTRFDSVPFPSQFLDIVHEQCSSQFFFSNFFIKLN